MLGLSASEIWRMSVDCFSSTSRFGFVAKSVNVLVPFGTLASPSNGLNHALASVACQTVLVHPVQELVASLMIRILFFAGPDVTSSEKFFRSDGVTGFRSTLLTVIGSKFVAPPSRNVT